MAILPIGGPFVQLSVKFFRLGGLNCLGLVDMSQSLRRFPEGHLVAQELPYSAMVLRPEPPGSRPRDPILPTSGSTTVDEPLFRFLVELEVAKAQRLKYCVSVVCLAIDSLPDDDYSFIKRMAERFIRHLRSTDVVAPYPASSLTILLVDAEAPMLSSIVHRITEHLGPIPWSAGGASYPKTASGAQDLLGWAFDLAARAKEDGGHRLYLPP